MPAADLDIYTGFSKEMKWIRDIHRKELASFPPAIYSLANYYLSERLLILGKKPIAVDPRFGRPSPYLVFWFAKNFGLRDELMTKNLGLAASYISLCVSIRDDLIDGRPVLSFDDDNKPASVPACVYLANIYYQKFYDIFKLNQSIVKRSEFWSVLCDCLSEWSIHESWSYLFDPKQQHGRVKFDPLSYQFLFERSRYLVAIALPIIFAVAVLTGNTGKLPQIRQFLKHYCIAWKLIDDLRDWRKDLTLDNLNHSSVLYLAKNKIKSGILDNASVTNMFLDTNFVNEIYGTIVKYLEAAKKDIWLLRSYHLTKFLDSQIEYNLEARQFLLKSNEDFRLQLSAILLKNLG